MSRDGYNIENANEILKHMGEDLNELKDTIDTELKQKVISERRRVTAILEGILKCSLDERIDARNMSDEEWYHAMPQIMVDIDEPFRLSTSFDAAFMKVIKYIWKHSREELMEDMVRSLYRHRGNPVLSYIAESLRQLKAPVIGIMFRKLRQTERPTWLLRRRLTQFFTASPFWGTLNPKKKDFNTFELRAAVLKHHSYDFLWLYRRMEDSLSKRTLCAIIYNWVFGDTDELRAVKSIFSDYWEPDIFPDNKDDVLVDCGAFIGDSIEQYIKVYGDGYRKIYAYEIAKESYEKLCNNMRNMHDVECRYKGTGRTKAEMFVDSHDSYSGNHLCVEGGGLRVEVVTLDEDIEETITTIKMDIEGAELDSLLGCERTIREHTPRLAICIYHGYNDIWKIPLAIHEMYPDYHFYMRYNGASDEPFPTEFVLLCKP